MKQVIKYYFIGLILFMPFAFTCNLIGQGIRSLFLGTGMNTNFDLPYFGEILIGGSVAWSIFYIWGWIFKKYVLNKLFPPHEKPKL